MTKFSYTFPTYHHGWPVMNPAQLLPILLDTIRRGDFIQFLNILGTQAGKQTVNAPSNLNEQDILRLMRKTAKGRDILVPAVTTGCTPVFFCLLYGNSLMLEILTENGARVDVKTSGGIDLYTFGFGCFMTSRAQQIILKQDREAIFRSFDNPLNPYIIQNTGSTIAFANSEKEAFYDEPDILIAAATNGNLVRLQASLALQTHAKDTKGLAMGYAISGRHENCVRALKAAGVPIHGGHYYVAGKVGYLERTRFYDILKGESATRNTADRAPIPEFVTSGNIKKIYSQLQENAPEESEKSRWLYYSLIMGHILAARLLLEKNVPLEKRHFFAAGRFFKLHDDASEKMSVRMHLLLGSFEDNTPLPNLFYSEDEQRVYNDMLNTNTAQRQTMRI